MGIPRVRLVDFPPVLFRYQGVADENHGRIVEIRAGKHAVRYGVYMERAAVKHQILVAGPCPVNDFTRDPRCTSYEIVPREHIITLRSTGFWVKADDLHFVPFDALGDPMHQRPRRSSYTRFVVPVATDAPPVALGGRVGDVSDLRRATPEQARVMFQQVTAGGVLNLGPAVPGGDPHEVPEPEVEEALMRFALVLSRTHNFLTESLDARLTLWIGRYQQDGTATAPESETDLDEEEGGSDGSLPSDS